jgi:antitoxin (DNA-binding transcriptional repressor) of toxin-antitoxin stability system
MARKSDKRVSSRVSATLASRTFSDLLDSVERGRRFVIQRRGRDVCVMAPPPVATRKASDCLAVLRARAGATLDDQFSADLTAIVDGEPIERAPSWDS